MALLAKSTLLGLKLNGGKRMNLCKIFGVKENEEFNLPPFAGDYKIINNVLHFKYLKGFSPIDLSINTLSALSVKKLPFKPKKGEFYWTIDSKVWSAIQTSWQDSPVDFMRSSMQIVFRTYEEAAFACPEFYEKLTGGNWEDDF